MKVTLNNIRLIDQLRGGGCRSKQFAEKPSSEVVVTMASPATVHQVAPIKLIVSWELQQFVLGEVGGWVALHTSEWCFRNRLATSEQYWPTITVGQFCIWWPFHHHAMLVNAQFRSKFVRLASWLQNQHWTGGKGVRKESLWDRPGVIRCVWLMIFQKMDKINPCVNTFCPGL